MKSIFKVARDFIDERERSVIRERKREMGESKVAYVRRYRRERREFLFSRVKDRTCPVCMRVKLRSRQWVFLDMPLLEKLERRPVRTDALDKFIDSGAVCRGCFVKHFAARSNKGASE